MTKDQAWQKWYAASELKQELDRLPEDVDGLLKRLLLTKVAAEAFGAGWEAGWSEGMERVSAEIRNGMAVKQPLPPSSEPAEQYVEGEASEALPVYEGPR